MKYIFTCCLLVLASVAEAKVSQSLLDRFQTFATRDLIMFGAPKTLELTYEISLQGYFVKSENIILGNAVVYERCLAKLANEEIQLSCYEGISAGLDLCKIKPSICQEEGIKQKMRQLMIDPSMPSGDQMRGLGTQTLIPHMNYLTNLAKENPLARKAIAQALVLNGCTSVELGDVAGQISYLEAQPLADDDTRKPFEGAQNRWRAIMRCRSAGTSVYLDILSEVVKGKINLSLIPIRAVEGPRVHIETVEPSVGRHGT